VCWGPFDAYNEDPDPGVALSSLSTGYYGSCGIATDDSSMVCWRSYFIFFFPAPPGAFSQVVAGYAASRSALCFAAALHKVAKPVSSVLRVVRFCAVSPCRESHACGIQTDGRLQCWSAFGVYAVPLTADTYTQVVCVAVFRFMCLAACCLS
jgi:hypothetical protein